jgi:hypothetical protein
MNDKDIIEIRMFVPDEACTGNYAVVKVSENRYKLANNDPFSEFLTYGTTIEVQPEKKIEEEEEVFVFKEVYAESKFGCDVVMLPMALNETEMRVVGEMITAEGGYWEVIFGGMGFVNLPKNSKLNVIDELNKMIKATEKK